MFSVMLVDWYLIVPLNTDFHSLYSEKQKEEPKKPQKLGKFGKDPGVETGFLPDRYDYCTSPYYLTLCTCSWWMRVGI